MMKKEALAILVGGGPAPGINGVISAATIEAINRGHRVFGIQNGFSKLLKRDTSCARELTIAAVSRISRDGGSILGTSRANPTRSAELLENVVSSLRELGVSYLVTIGGDDTASSARAVAVAADGAIRVGHVPKTIDNDLPLPGMVSTFGYQTAREVGTDIVETLMVDAKTTGRWYLVVAMGRKAGHLALGIGMSAAATLTLIPEQFEQNLRLTVLADIIVGSILKRMVRNRPYGVVVLAEGLAEILDPASIPELSGAERDPHGHIRFAELDFGGLVKNAVRDRLSEFGITDMTVVDKDVGYELRCRAPVAFDREYIRQLGYGVVDFLLTGGNQAIISRQGDQLEPLPFEHIIDPQTGRSKVRLVDTSSATYRVAQRYMIRLTTKDLQEGELVNDIARLTHLEPETIRERLSPAAALMT